MPFLIPLVSYAADVNARLIEAAKQGDTATVEALLEQGADVNARERKGQTALIRAALLGHTDTVQALLAAGADVNAKGKLGWTALMWVAGKGHTDTVQALLAAGADVNAKDRGGDHSLDRGSMAGSQRHGRNPARS